MVEIKDKPIHWTVADEGPAPDGVSAADELSCVIPDEWSEVVSPRDLTPEMAASLSLDPACASQSDSTQAIALWQRLGFDEVVNVGPAIGSLNHAIEKDPGRSAELEPLLFALAAYEASLEKPADQSRRACILFFHRHFALRLGRDLSAADEVAQPDRDKLRPLAANYVHAVVGQSISEGDSSAAREAAQVLAALEPGSPRLAQLEVVDGRLVGGMANATLLEVVGALQRLGYEVIHDGPVTRDRITAIHTDGWSDVQLQTLFTRDFGFAGAALSGKQIWLMPGLGMLDQVVEDPTIEPNSDKRSALRVLTRTESQKLGRELISTVYDLTFVSGTDVMDLVENVRITLDDFEGEAGEALRLLFDDASELHGPGYAMLKTFLIDATAGLHEGFDPAVADAMRVTSGPWTPPSRNGFADALPSVDEFYESMANNDALPDAHWPLFANPLRDAKNRGELPGFLDDAKAALVDDGLRDELDRLVSIAVDENTPDGMALMAENAARRLLWGQIFPQPLRDIR